MLIEYVLAWVPLVVLAFFWLRVKRQHGVLAVVIASALTASALLVLQLSLPWRVIRPRHSAAWESIVSANLFVSLGSIALFGFKRMEQVPILVAAVVLSIYWFLAVVFISAV